MLLNKAIAIAAIAHDGQVDKCGEPYILHPLRVMNSAQYTTEKIVAVLHDVIEDSDINTNDLRDCGFPSHIVDVIEALSKQRNETYADYIKRVNKNPLAKIVKLLDIEDNMSPTRMAKLDNETKLRLYNKYKYARTYLHSH